MMQQLGQRAKLLANSPGAGFLRQRSSWVSTHKTRASVHVPGAPRVICTLRNANQFAGLPYLEFCDSLYPWENKQQVGTSTPHDGEHYLPAYTAAATDRKMSTKSCFKGTTAQELQAWLETAGVPVDGVYGHGLAKTVDELLDEVQKHESVLELDSGKALRIVNVLSVHVLNSRGQVLFEDEQVLPDGRSRRRNVPLSEKMIGAERWQQALHRAVAEELSSALPQDYTVTPHEESYFSRIELSSSMSYPGLLTKYIFHRVKANITGIPEGGFSTVEERPNGQLLTKWVWRAVPTEAF